MQSVVLWASESSATTPKRPQNTSADDGSSSSESVRSEGFSLSATMMSNAPIQSASGVYKGDIAEPKFSTGYTACLSIATGAASSSGTVNAATSPSSTQKSFA